MSNHKKDQTKEQVVFLKSPNNSRNNPETNKSIWSKARAYFLNEWKAMLGSFIIGLLLMAIAYVAVDIYVQQEILQVQNEKRNELFGEINTWETIIASHPDYRDGHFQLALLYYQTGDVVRAKKYLDMSLSLDPNFKQAREFQQQIEEK